VVRCANARVHTEEIDFLRYVCKKNVETRGAVGGDSGWGLNYLDESVHSCKSLEEAASRVGADGFTEVRVVSIEVSGEKDDCVELNANFV
jgi:hypothetical protein